ncbi:hypothetical protein [Paracoccus albus]|nr:hypothetical protein [Paracoccus albus]WBU59219.1 hypothetical protein PAF20_10510 [Paracoccus albus]
MLIIGTPKEVRDRAGDSAGQTMNDAFIAVVEQHRAASKAQPTAA